MESFLLFFTSAIGVGVLSIIALLMLTYYIEKEAVDNIVVMFIAGFLVASYFADAHTRIYDFTINNFTSVTIWFCGYLAIGVVWSIIKWNLYVREIFQKFQAYVKREIESSRFTSGPDGDKTVNFIKMVDSAVTTYLTSIMHTTSYDFRDALVTQIGEWKVFSKENVLSCLKITLRDNCEFTVKRKTSLISCWVILWPISILGYFIADFMSNFVAMVVKMFKGVYNKISEKHAAALF